MPDTNSNELTDALQRAADAASGQMAQSDALMGAARFGHQVATYYQALRLGGVPERPAAKMAAEYAEAILDRVLWPDGHGECGG